MTLMQFHTMSGSFSSSSEQLTLKNTEPQSWKSRLKSSFRLCLWLVFCRTLVYQHLLQWKYKITQSCQHLSQIFAAFDSFQLGVLFRHAGRLKSSSSLGPLGAKPRSHANTSRYTRYNTSYIQHNELQILSSVYGSNQNFKNTRVNLPEEVMEDFLDVR